MTPTLPRSDALHILFAHPIYRIKDAFHALKPGIRTTEVKSYSELLAHAPEAGVIVASGMWRQEVLDAAKRLVFVQSISAGTDKFDLDAFRARGVKLASAHGVAANAVAEHAMALILALSRKVHHARDNQANKFWRPYIEAPLAREREQDGRTLLIIGMGRIGARLARFGKAFDMHVIGVKRDLSTGTEGADQAVTPDKLFDVLPRADVVVLACPLTPQTTGLIDARALSAMKPGVHLINVARGRVVVEDALIAALKSGQVEAAGLDCVVDEPLPASSALWGIENALITPHTGGETQVYENRLAEVLAENLERLWRGEARLRNEVV